MRSRHLKIAQDLGNHWSREHLTPRPWNLAHHHFRFAQIRGLINGFDVWLLEPPTMTNKLMSRRDAVRVSSIMRGKAKRLHLGLVSIHLEHQGRANPTKLLALVIGGLWWQYQPDRAHYYLPCPDVIIWYLRRLDVSCLSNNIKRPGMRIVYLLEAPRSAPSPSSQRSSISTSLGMCTRGHKWRCFLDSVRGGRNTLRLCCSIC